MVRYKGYGELNRAIRRLRTELWYQQMELDRTFEDRNWYLRRWKNLDVFHEEMDCHVNRVKRAQQDLDAALEVKDRWDRSNRRNAQRPGPVTARPPAARQEPPGA